MIRASEPRRTPARRLAWLFLLAAPALQGSLATMPEATGDTAAGPGLSPVKMEVIGDRVNVRARPGVRYEIVCQVLRGDHVTVVSREGDWSRIKAPAGSTVWVHGAFLRDSRVIGDRVNLRAGPSLSYSIVGRVTRGDVVEAKSEYNEWIEIEPPPGAALWVKSQFLQAVAGATASAIGESTVIETMTPPVPEGAETIVIHGELPADDTAQPAQETSSAETGQAAPADPGLEAAQTPTDEASDAPPEELALPAEDTVATPTEPAESEVKADASVGTETGAAAVPPARPEGEALVLPEAEIEWLGPPKDVARNGEIHRTGFLIRRPGSHKLIQRSGRRARLICYLRSDQVDLDRFIGKEVRIVGAEQWAKGWPRPVIHVRQASLVR